MRDAVLGVLLAIEAWHGPAAGRAVRAAQRPPAETVVFVCEHGSVKSLIAALWFERLARERGLELRAVSRGLTPDAAVPPAIVERLKKDGFDVDQFRPSALSRSDLEGANRVVAIGVDTSSVTVGSGVPVEVWDNIPPASVRYDEARDALRARMEALFEKPRQ